MPAPAGSSSGRKGDSPLGRPTAKRAAALRQTLINTASALMLARGYDGASIDAIATAAGVSKRTLYSRFSSKELLLREVLAQAALPAFRPMPVLAPATSGRDALILIAHDIHGVLLHPDMQRWLRFAITNLGDRPELMAFVHTLVDQYLAFIQAMLEAVIAQTGLEVRDVAESARFFGILIAEPAKNLAFLARPPGSKAEQAHYIDAAVDVFLGGCAVKA